VQIEWPIHGAVLHPRLGTIVGEDLEIGVRGRASLHDRVTVNGEPVQRSGERFEAKVRLRDPRETIVARADGPGGITEHAIQVVCDRTSRPRYRFAIDDNIFFLRDIVQQDYASLLDSPYLQNLSRLHDRYGARFAVNIYWTDGHGFDLTQIPDRYRGQWEDLAEWLRLSFHAWANEPDRPYEYASPERLARDFDRVGEEILRFGGEAVYAPPTVIHWGMLPSSCWPVLAERGVRVLSGIFRKFGYRWDINYNLDDQRSAYIAENEALMDFDTGIVFSRVDIVCNNTPVEEVTPLLGQLAGRPETAEFMDLFTHEQYFWPDYPRYVPDHWDRVEAAIRWVTERGYVPVFFHEGLLGR